MRIFKKVYSKEKKLKIVLHGLLECDDENCSIQRNEKYQSEKSRLDHGSVELFGVRVSRVCIIVLFRHVWLIMYAWGCACTNDRMDDSESHCSKNRIGML